MNNFSIIIPTLNEAENIPSLLQRISDVAKVFNFQPEIIFIDVGSTDDTCKRVREYNDGLKVSLLQRKVESGLSGAVIAGAKAARHDNLVIMDGDLSHHPESIPELISPLLSGEYDMVIGSRYCRGGKISGWPLLRWASSRLASLPAHFLTGIEDPLSRFFGIRKELATVIPSNNEGFKIGFEILNLHGNDMRVKEVAIHFTDRESGSSKMNGTFFLKYLHQLCSFVGIEIPANSFPLFLLIGIFGGLFDATLFFWLTEANINPVSCHMVSFFMTVHLLYVLGLPETLGLDLPEGVRPFTSTYRHLLLIMVPVLFLRGGLFAMANASYLSLETTSGLLGLPTGLSWFIFAATLKTSVARTGRPMGILVVMVILYSLLLRFLYLGTTELIQEEAYYWNYAQHLAPGYLDHPPLVAVFIWIGTHLFGHTEAGIRSFAYLCWFATACFSYKLTKRMYCGRSATYAVLLVAILPIFFGAALVMTPDAPLLVCWAATLYFLYKALIEEHNISWLFAGIAFGLGLASKYTIALLMPATFLFMLIDPQSRKRLCSPMPYLSIVVAVLCFSPVIWWNIQNDWASFLFQSRARLLDLPMFTTHKLIGSVLLLLTPAGLATALLAVLPWDIKSLKKNLIGHKNGRPYLFTLMLTAVPFLIIFFFSLTKEIKINWTGPIWLVTLPFMAHSLQRTIHTPQKGSTVDTFFATGWSKTVLSLILVYGMGLHYLSIGLPGIPFPTNNILLGWEKLAQKVEKKVHSLEITNGKRPVIVGMDKYRIASGVSFYRSRDGVNPGDKNLPAITGRHLFGLNSLMFSYWHPSTLFSHQDLLVLSQSQISLHPLYFKDRAMNVGSIKEFTVTKNGKEITKFYYRVLRGYIPSQGKNVAGSM